MPLTLKAATNKDRAQPVSAKFEHRHFAEIARIIRSMPLDVARESAMDTFAAELARTNPRFDRTRFVCACIPTGE